MITVHHLNNSRSQRILWLLEELGRPYRVVRYERDPHTMAAPPELKAAHPLGKSPVIEDGPLRLAESGAIVEYLAGEPGSDLVPARGSQAYLDYLHVLHFAEGSAMPPLLVKLYLGFIGDVVPTAVRARIDGQIASVLDDLERLVRPTGWFAGHRFSAADVMISFPLEIAVRRGGLDAGRPGLWDFLARIHARPAYARALERGGPYAYA